MKRARPFGQELRSRWDDGVYLQARLQDEAQCILVPPTTAIRFNGLVRRANPSAEDRPKRTKRGMKGLVKLLVQQLSNEDTEDDRLF
jgi:hypothetical protein